MRVRPDQDALRAGVLIGGLSRRMGKPKQLVELDGKPLLDYVVDAVSPFGPVYLIGDGPTTVHHQDLPRLSDAEAFQGPIAGIMGALQSHSTGWWLIVACDQPWLSKQAIEWLLGQRQQSSTAVIPHDANGAQPFPGLYETSFQTTVSTGGQGRVGISSLASAASVHSPRLPESPLRRGWASVNTVGDLQSALVDANDVSA